MAKVYYYKYIRPSELAAHKKDGWVYVGKMRGKNSRYEGANHDSIIVRKRG
jgi:hypothetical protein